MKRLNSDLDLSPPESPVWRSFVKKVVALAGALSQPVWKMANDPLSLNLPPSGAWCGYYLYPGGGAKHWMKLSLTFAGNGQIDGDGIDDIAPFLIDGVFDHTTGEASWMKSYIGMHRVRYRGSYDQRSIRGVWTLTMAAGEFQIWPGASDQGEEETAHADIEEPELVTV